MSLEIHASSVETLYFPVRSEHPTNGEIDLSGQTVEVALPAVGAAPSSWVAASWLSGTLRKGDDRYYVASAATSGYSLSSGTTYQAWVRVGGASGAIVKSGTVKAINT